MTGVEARVATLRVTGALIAVVGGVATLGGAAMIAGDLSTRTDEWDGIWIFFGILVGVPGLVLVLAGVTVARTAGRGTVTPAVITGAVGVLTAVVGVREGAILGLALTTPLLGVGLVLIAVAAACGRPTDT